MVACLWGNIVPLKDDICPGCEESIADPAFPFLGRIAFVKDTAPRQCPGALTPQSTECFTVCIGCRNRHMYMPQATPEYHAMMVEWRERAMALRL